MPACASWGCSCSSAIASREVKTCLAPAFRGAAVGAELIQTVRQLIHAVRQLSAAVQQRAESVIQLGRNRPSADPWHP